MEHSDWIEAGRNVLDIEIQGLNSLKDQIGPEFIRAVELLAQCRGRVVVTGLGKSGLVGRKVAATFSSTGTPAFFLHPVEGAHGDMGALRAEDIVIAISYSGKTQELNAIIPALRRFGCPVIGITGKPESMLGRLCDIVLNVNVPREACPHNLAPTASTTATLAMGDALAVCLMQAKSFTEKDFLRCHPAGALGERLAQKAADCMHTRDIPRLPDTALIQDALPVLDTGGFGTVVFTNAQNELTGILTDGDVRRNLCRGVLCPEAPVSGIMTRNPAYARPDQSVAELLDLMENKAITTLPVLGPDKQLLGLVHMHDLLGKGSLTFSRQ